MAKGNRTTRRGHKPREFDTAIPIRCTDEQRAAWEAAADGEGVSIAEWARETLDAAAARAATASEDCE